MTEVFQSFQYYNELQWVQIDVGEHELEFQVPDTRLKSTEFEDVCDGGEKCIGKVMSLYNHIPDVNVLVYPKGDFDSIFRWIAEHATGSFYDDWTPKWTELQERLDDKTEYVTYPTNLYCCSPISVLDSIEDIEVNEWDAVAFTGALFNADIYYVLFDFEDYFVEIHYKALIGHNYGLSNVMNKHTFNTIVDTIRVP